MFKDFLGNKVDIGDYIFYSSTGRYPESKLGKIVRFTEKTIFIDVVKSNRFGSLGKDVRVQNDFVKVSYTEKD